METYVIGLEIEWLKINIKKTTGRRAMKKSPRIRAEVVHIIYRNEKRTALIRLLSGELADNQILICQETGVKWKVKGFAFIPAKAHSEGKRDVWFEKIGNGPDLQQGFTLVAE